MAKEKLAIEITQVNGVQVNDMNFAEASQNEILEELASNATCTDH